MKKFGRLVMAKMQSVKAKVSTAVTTAATTVVMAMTPGYCAISENSAIDANGTVGSTMKIIFNASMMAGLVMIGIGAFLLIRKLIGMFSDDGPQQGGIGKGFGFLIAGIILCALRAIITAISGVDPTTIKLI